MTSQTPPVQDARVNTVLDGRYRVVAQLAAGAMGAVYRGERVQLGRPVAIKFLHVALATHQDLIRRFEVEARAMSRLSHPNCVSIIDFGVADAPYLVMDFVSGKTLRALMDEGPIPAARAIEIAKQLLAGLGHAHKQQIIHRDIKPTNIVINEDESGDHVRILDFGLAKLRDGGLSVDGSLAAQAIGTPSYMPPEQVRGERVEARTDLYSAGVVIFEMLAQRKPFVCKDILQMLKLQVEEPPPRLNSVAKGVCYSTEIEAVLAKAIAKHPDERFQSAPEFAAALAATPEAGGFPATPLTPPLDASTDAIHGTGVNSDESFASVESVNADYAPVESVNSVQIVDADSIDAPVVLSRHEKLRVPHRVRPSFVLAAILAVVGLGAWHFFRQQTAERTPPVRPSSASHQTRTVAAAIQPQPHQARFSDPVDASLPQLDGSADTRALQGSSTGIDAQIGDASLLTTSHVSPDAGVESHVDAAPADAGPADAAAQQQDTTPDSHATMQEATVKPVTLTDVRRLIRKGDVTQALRELHTLHRRNPKNAYITRLTGDLYCERHYFEACVGYYAAAIKLRPRYRHSRKLIRNTIDALSSKRAAAHAATLLIRQIGRAARPHLKKAAARHENTRVRKRAKRLLRRIR